MYTPISQKRLVFVDQNNVQSFESLDQNNSSCGIHFSKVLVQIQKPQFREAYWWNYLDDTCN
jgi:hypothetical protein